MLHGHRSRDRVRSGQPGASVCWRWPAQRAPGRAVPSQPEVGRSYPASTRPWAAPRDARRRKLPEATGSTESGCCGSSEFLEAEKLRPDRRLGPLSPWSEAYRSSGGMRDRRRRSTCCRAHRVQAEVRHTAPRLNLSWPSTSLAQRRFEEAMARRELLMADEPTFAEALAGSSEPGPWARRPGGWPAEAPDRASRRRWREYRPEYWPAR